MMVQNVQNQCYAAPIRLQPSIRRHPAPSGAIRRHPAPSGAKSGSGSRLHLHREMQWFLNGDCLSRRRLRTAPVEPHGPHLAPLATPAGPLDSRCVFLGNHICHAESIPCAPSQEMIHFHVTCCVHRVNCCHPFPATPRAQACPCGTTTLGDDFSQRSAYRSGWKTKSHSALGPVTALVGPRQMHGLQL
jgi:hypothetical protein